MPIGLSSCTACQAGHSFGALPLALEHCEGTYQSDASLLLEIQQAAWGRDDDAGTVFDGLALWPLGDPTVDADGAKADQRPGSSAHLIRLHGQLACRRENEHIGRPGFIRARWQRRDVHHRGKKEGQRFTRPCLCNPDDVAPSHHDGPAAALDGRRPRKALARAQRRFTETSIRKVCNGTEAFCADASHLNSMLLMECSSCSCIHHADGSTVCGAGDAACCPGSLRRWCRLSGCTGLRRCREALCSIG